MKKGLVFGKFMPLHKGHIALIEFALKHCDKLYVVICFTGKEPINYLIRKQWLYQFFENAPSVTIVSFGYDEKDLPNTSVSSREVSKLWAEAFKKLLPDVDIVFTSEKYGDYVAEYMGIEHLCFDEMRNTVPVSGSAIRSQPLGYWDYIPSLVHTFFVRKVCIVGTESTGKSTLTEKLAQHFNTAFVPEMARDIVEITDECTYEDLLKIAKTHAMAIIEKQLIANKLLFVDTDVNITCSYSEFLFNRPLVIENWIGEANRFDLYLFLEADCEYIQDGTRLSEKERNRLSDQHKRFFGKKGINFITIGGNWQNRFDQACKIVNDTFGPLS